MTPFHRSHIISPFLYILRNIVIQCWVHPNRVWVQVHQSPTHFHCSAIRSSVRTVSNWASPVLIQWSHCHHKWATQQKLHQMGESNPLKLLPAANTTPEGQGLIIFPHPLQIQSIQVYAKYKWDPLENLSSWSSGKRAKNKKGKWESP